MHNLRLEVPIPYPAGQPALIRTWLWLGQGVGPLSADTPPRDSSVLTRMHHTGVSSFHHTDRIKTAGPFNTTMRPNQG